MTKSKSFKVGKVIMYVVLIALLATSVGLAYRFTNGFQGDFSTLEILKDGEKIESGQSFVLTDGKPLDLECKNVVGTAEEKPLDYTVSVVVNKKATDFDFVVDGRLCPFVKQGDVTTGFDIQRTDNGFCVSSGGGMVGVLGKFFGSSVELRGNLVANENYFILVIMLPNKTEKRFPFALTVNVTGLEIVSGGLIFYE